MNDMRYEKIGEANSRAEAEVIKSFLEAEGINVELVEESFSHSSYAMPLTRVQIFVSKENVEQARELLEPFDDILQKEDDDNDDE
jgi:hypothetical protein